MVFVLALISFVFGFIMTRGPHTWSEYKVRPAFAVAGIVILVLFILAAIVSMYNVVFIEK